MSKAKKPALGRGLSALLKDASTDITSSGSVPVGGVSMILLNQIEANPFQPRTEFEKEALEELADSIRLHGVIQPITVRKLGNDRFQIISGERRTRASILAGETEIPAYVRVANDQSMLEMALIENIQREDLNAIEVALSYQRLMEECRLKLEELGDRVGKKRSTVNNYIRLLKLPEEIQTAILHEELSMGQARALINISDPKAQLKVFQQTLSDNLSVREVEALARELKDKKPSKGKKNQETYSAPDWDLEAYEDKMNELAEKLEVPVRIKSAKSGGELVLSFRSEEELEKLLKQL